MTGICSLRLARCRLSWPALVRRGFAVQACAFLALALTSSDVFTDPCVGALSLGGQSPYASTPSLLGPSPFDPVTAVAGNVWVAKHLWGLLQDGRAPAVAAAKPVSGAG